MHAQIPTISRSGHRRRLPWVYGGLVGAVAVVALWFSGSLASASTRLGVYQGVVSVVWNNPDNVLELGYGGQDLAASSVVYLRPGAVAKSNGVKFYRNGNVTNLDIPGSLCLYHHNGSGVIDSTADCKNIWPASGGGANNWQIKPGTSSGGQPTNYLEPNDASGFPTYGIHIGGPLAAQHITGGIAATLDSSDAFGGGPSLGATNLNPSGPAIQYVGNVNVGFSTYVGGFARVAGQEVWSYYHQGENSGLDADTLNGQDVTIEGYASCSDDLSQPHIICLCFTIRLGTPATYSKHCTPMGNNSFY